MSKFGIWSQEMDKLTDKLYPVIKKNQQKVTREQVGQWFNEEGFTKFKEGQLNSYKNYKEVNGEYPKHVSKESVEIQIREGFAKLLAFFVEQFGAEATTDKMNRLFSDYVEKAISKQTNFIELSAKVTGLLNDKMFEYKQANDKEMPAEIQYRFAKRKFGIQEKAAQSYLDIMIDYSPPKIAKEQRSIFTAAGSKKRESGTKTVRFALGNNE